MRNVIAALLALTSASAPAATLTVYEINGPQADRIGRMPEDMVPQLIDQQRRSGLISGSTVTVVADGADHVETIDRSLSGVVFIDGRRLSVTRTQAVANVMQIWHAGTPQAGISASARIMRKSGFPDTSGNLNVPVDEVRAEGRFRLDGQEQAAVSYAAAAGSRGAQAIVIVYQP